MEESSLAQIIDGEGGEEQCDEEFYEKIEAPKFVDFTAPERRRPDDDCYWFCMRAGCDRKHEEEIDPEAIYNNFVLRVMAARSPNIRFRRAMDRKALSTNLKCPQTAPPKPTRTRASRLETISSFSQKTVNGKPLTKLSATPRVKASRPDAGAAKALTTPRNRKRVSNPRPFQSVRKPKALDAGLAKSKVVAKTLFFHSPKKAVKLKASLELNTPLRKICSGMKKLEITSQKKHVLVYDKTLPSDGFRKKLGVREVKSRVFDSLRCKGQEVKSVRCLKRKEVKQCELEPNIDEKSRKRSLDVRESGACKKSAEVTPDNSRCDLIPLPNDSGDNDSTKIHAGDSKNESKCDETTKSGSEEQKIQECTILDDHNEENAAARGDKENASSSDVKESNEEVMESDDKENASAPDANMERDHPSQGNAAKSKILGKNKNSKCTQKVIQVLGKTNKDSNSATSGMHVMKYRKPKPTNPKPFRLRTDERRILKEANMETKLLLPPLNEVATVTKVSKRKQLDAPKEGTRKDQEQPREMASHVDSQPKHCLDGVADKEVKGIAKMTKSPLMNQPARPQGRLSSSGKNSALKIAPRRRLSAISATLRTMLKPLKASTKLLEKEAKLKLHSSPSTSRSLSRGRTRDHTPKEPKISTALKF